MADLKEARTWSLDKSSEEGKLFHCTIAKGKNKYL